MATTVDHTTVRQARRPPTLLAIAEYWLSRPDRFPENPQLRYGLDQPCCMACGWRPPAIDGTEREIWARTTGLHRAHLAPRWPYGLDGVQNQVNLCKPCHGEMNDSDDHGELALLWLRTHDSYNEIVTRRVERLIALLGTDGAIAAAESGLQGR